jgi:hypothetical protein
MLPFSDDLSLAEAALHYAEHGYAVIPLHTILPSSGACSCGRPTCTSPAKHPLTANGLKDATTDEDTVRRWWQTWPSANIGVVTGSRSNNLTVLDFDGGKYDDDAFNKVQDLLGDLPLTSTGWTVKTGSGFHAWFQSDQAKQIKNSASKLSPGVDIRGEGGYVVAPPSLHWTKANYAWNHTQALALPVLPTAWADYILASQSQPAPAPAAQPGQSQTIPQGQRNNDLTRIAGKLRHAGLEQAELEAALLKINQERCQPPLSDREVRLIAKSVSRYAVGDDQDWSGLTTGLDDAPDDPTIIQDFTFGLNFFDLEDMDMTLFEEGEQILHYLYPGELACLVAVPSAGKSTLILNTLLCMAAGRPFLPIFNGSAPRKSLYIDFENRPNRIQADLRKMRAIFTDDERETIKNNLFVAVDPKWNNSFFAITQPGCLDALAKWVRHRGIHLVVFDTMAQAADIADENNNAEIQRKIIRPLNQFAQKSNCAVLLVHHMGKKTHGEHEMFSSRGASSLTGAVRLQMNINHVRNQQGLIELTCSKVKGEKFKPTVFEYDHDSRWFMEYTRPVKAKPKSIYDHILDMFKDDSVIIKTYEIKTAWDDEFGEKTVERALTSLVAEGYLVRAGKGKYKLAPPENDSENNEDS